MQAVSRLWTAEAIADILPHYLILALLEMQWNAGLCLLLEDVCTALDEIQEASEEDTRKWKQTEDSGLGHLVTIGR